MNMQRECYMMNLRRIHLISLEQRIIIRDVESRRIAPFAALYEEILLEFYEIQFECVPLSLFKFNLP